MSTDPAERERQLRAFEAEAKLLASLDHIRLARVLDFFEEQSVPYIVMDFIEGHSLEHFSGLPQSFESVVLWTHQLLSALRYLHGRSPPIIVRDLKPANIMLTRDGQIKLVDFGIARQLAPGTHTDTFMKGAGSEGFAPIEQYGRGTTDERSDLYSLGATLYFLLTGEAPPDPIARVQGGLLRADIPGVPQAFWTGLNSLLEVTPADRPASIAVAEQMLFGKQVNSQAQAPSPAVQSAANSAGVPLNSAIQQTPSGPSVPAGSELTSTSAWGCAALTLLLPLVGLIVGALIPSPHPRHSSSGSQAGSQAAISAAPSPASSQSGQSSVDQARREAPPPDWKKFSCYEGDFYFYYPPGGPEWGPDQRSSPDFAYEVKYMAPGPIYYYVGYQKFDEPIGEKDRRMVQDKMCSYYGADDPEQFQLGGNAVGFHIEGDFGYVWVVFTPHRIYRVMADSFEDAIHGPALRNGAYTLWRSFHVYSAE